ncbi:MAG TPA: phospholipase D-like domain-containing protein [Gemmatimonadales bacterium]|nr:phospholipase D-like domain-containing protein [Gemmatimonadales bacterium]
MSEWLGFGSDLPWWGWALIAIGVIAIVSVIGALFLPDWHDDDYTVGFEADPGSESFVEWSAAFLNGPIFQGGEVTLLQNGDAFFPAILKAIKEARDSVNFEVYIFEPDEIGRQFIEAFKERARAGVEVRLLLDGFGAMKLKKRYRDDLQKAGVKISRFRPLSLRSLPRFYKRTHRRAIVIDGRVGFTGGAAVSAKWKGNVTNAHEWRDSMTRVTGPLVGGIQSAFAENWVYCCGEVIAGPRFFPQLDRGKGPCSLSVVSSPSDALQPIRLLFWLSFINARHRLWICNSYFIPDRRLRVAVIERARAGVDVRVLVPGNHTDALPVQATGRSYYEELLAAGVRIFEYQPAMMHAKTVVVDGAWSVVGSANLDERSMELNEENILGIADRDFARAVEEGVVADLERSREIHLDQWRKRPIYQRIFERAAKALIEQY